MADATCIASAGLGIGRRSTHSACAGVPILNAAVVVMVVQRLCGSSAAVKPAAGKAGHQAGRCGRLRRHPVRLERVAVHVARLQPATSRMLQVVRSGYAVQADKARLPARRAGSFAAVVYVVHGPRVPYGIW